MAHLKSSSIIKTVDRLRARMTERFPDRGITEVVGDVCDTARESAAVSEELSKPLIIHRVISGLVIAGIIGALAWMFVSMNPDLKKLSFSDLVQTAESLVNDLIFIAIAIYFLIRRERRVKRAKALDMIHKLRSLAHIIDMHQLTKDPESVTRSYKRTLSSPERDLTTHELKRYFDYCSEMLSIVSKLAAMLVQDFDDPLTLSGVNEIESLTSGLSRKIWQKIMITASTQDLADPVATEPAPAPQATATVV
jgi:hypothetical protein